MKFINFPWRSKSNEVYVNDSSIDQQVDVYWQITNHAYNCHYDMNIVNSIEQVVVRSTPIPLNERHGLMVALLELLRIKIFRIFKIFKGCGEWW